MHTSREIPNVPSTRELASAGPLGERSLPFSRRDARAPLNRRGFTLLEMSIVIMVLIALLSTGLFVTRKMDEWRHGREASEALRAVYAAQRILLSDYPTRAVSTLTANDIIPYLPNNATALPTIKDANGNTISILVNQSPPVASASSGLTYDPSGSSRDSLWDVGQ